MFGSPTFDLLSRGRAAAKAGEKAEARRYLERMLNLDPPTDERLEALYWLSESIDDPVEQRGLLEEILANNLGDARARRKLAILDGKLRPDEIVDPDRAAALTAGDPQSVQTRSFTCPKCGGRMAFAPDGVSLVCDYCDGRQRIAAGPQAEEDDFLVAMATAKAQNRPVSMQAVRCSGCGANFVLPPEVITQTCPYCQTPYAINQVEVRTLDAPDSILPFCLTAEQARAALKEWLEGDPPEGAVKLARPSGVYLPVWLFNMGGQVDWNGYVYKNKQRVPVSGTRVVGRQNLLIPAAKRLPDPLAPALRGYDLDALQPYDARYLAGIPAETFQVAAGDASLEARQMALQLESRAALESELDRSVSDFSLRTTHMLVEGYRLALVPLWLAYYMVDERRYDVAINGQTGAVTGERPEKGVLGWMKSLF
jgi:tetratricopeptide (TPR) repeat protein